MVKVTRTRLLRLSIGVGIVAIISFIGFVIHSWDYPPLTVGDVDLSLLEYTSPEFSEAKDGGRFVVQASKATSDIDFRRLLRNKSWTAVATTVDVSAYAHAIELLYRASEYEVCYIPQEAHVSNLVNLAKVWLIEGRQAALRGDDAQAMKTYFHVLDLGSRLIAGHNTLLTVLMGVILQGLALDAMKEEMQANRLSRSMLDDTITRFENYQVTWQGVANAFRIEYRYHVSRLAQMETRVRWNPFKRL